jgi:hypothetical protein
MRSDIFLVMPDIPQELRRNGIDVGSLAVEDTAKAGSSWRESSAASLHSRSNSKCFGGFLRTRASGLDQDFDRLAFVHGYVAFRHSVQPDGPIEHPAGLDSAIEDVRQKLVDVRAHRSRPAAHSHVVEKSRQRSRYRLSLKNADAANCAVTAA